MKKIWDWYYGKASIRKKLIISYLILVILPILVLGMYSYYVSKKNLIRQTKHTMESNVDAISYSLQNDIQRETDNIKYLSYNAKLRGSLENGLKNRNALVKEMNDSVEPTFWYFIASDDKIKGIEIYSPYVKQSLGSFLKPLEGKEKRSWFRKNQNNFKTEWSVKDDRIYATRMILDSATSSTAIGYMRLEVFADEFLDGLFQSSYLNNGILLVDANGKKITERTIKDREINKKILEITKMLKINIKDFNLRLELGTEDAIITSFLVPIIGIIISYLLRQNMVDFKRQKFIIQPVYCNQNLLNLVFSGIFEIKMIHIINIIYVLIKGRGKEWKNERTTSNRRAYGHSYE